MSAGAVPPPPEELQATLAALAALEPEATPEVKGGGGDGRLREAPRQTEGRASAAEGEAARLRQRLSDAQGAAETLQRILAGTDTGEEVGGAQRATERPQAACLVPASSPGARKTHPKPRQATPFRRRSCPGASRAGGASWAVRRGLVRRALAVSLHPVQESLQAPDPVGPERLEVADPVDERAEALGPGPVVGPAPVAPASDEAGVAERGEVLGDGRLGDVEAGGEVLDGGLAAGERFEDGPAGGVGQGAEDEGARGGYAQKHKSFAYEKGKTP